MKILVIDPQSGGVGAYRHRVPANALEKLGIEVAYLDFVNNDEEAIAQFLLDNAKTCDLIHVGYLTNLEVVKLVVAAREYAGIPVITDVDDDILHVPEYNLAFLKYSGSAHCRRVARMHLRISDVVSTSTAVLAEQLADECRSTTVLPNCLDRSLWQGIPQDPLRRKDEHVRFMFAGNEGRYGDLSTVRSAFEWAMDKFPQLRLFFMGCMPDWAGKWMPSNTDPSKNRVFRVQLSMMETYPAILTWLRPDVFFSPVEQNTFNRSKSHIKAYDAAMCGAAFLCTDWDTHAAVPADAAVKVAGEYEWREAIEQLILDAELRRKLNSRLRDWCDDWVIDKHVDKWVTLYERVIKAGPVTSADQLVRPGG